MLSITFPAISPILFEFGPISIRWYSLAYIFGFIFAWKYIQYLIKQKGFFLVNHNISPKDVDDLIFYGIIGLIFGARFGYILFYNFSYYISEPIRMFYIWEGGLSFHGGLLGIVLAIFLFTKSKKISFLTSSLLSPSTISSNVLQKLYKEEHLLKTSFDKKKLAQLKDLACFFNKFLFIKIIYLKLLQTKEHQAFPRQGEFPLLQSIDF